MAYIGKGLDNGVRNQFIFAATQGQTAFSGADSDGKTLAISDILYTDCFQNGVKLEPTTDYTVTLTSLTLVNAASLNDVVDIVSFEVFAVPDTVPASTGGTFTGAISATSFTGSGASLTSLPAANLTGTVATARLGSGTAGTGNFLRGDGSWQTAGSTSASDLTSGTLPTARLPAGSVLQVVATTTTGQNSFTNTNVDTYADIGLNVNITPKSSSSYFLISCTIGIGTVVSSDSWGGVLFLNSTKIGNGANSSNRKGAFLRGVKSVNDSNHGVGAMNSFLYKTSLTGGTQVTFKVGGVVQGGTGYINRTQSFANTGSVYGATTSSTISVMEVAV